MICGHGNCECVQRVFLRYSVLYVMLALLHDLAKNGTPERPYPLIIDDSITDSTDGMIDYTYACGIGSGVMLVPFMEYYNQLSTDV